jgi:thiol-disulfide isomerase/thioredoxin
MVHELTSIGKILPSFAQTDTASKIVKLSDFSGKYVLVDFWASWCGPCRKENPHLIEAYQKYRSKKFEIIGVSIDTDKQHWLKAIHDDDLLWTQLSDLKGFNNSIARQFYIHGVPENFLIDPNGVIIAKGLKGQDLLNKLKILLD